MPTRFEVQKLHGPPPSPCHFGGACKLHATSGQKSSTSFMSVTLLNDEICERHFTINALTYGN